MKVEHNQESRIDKTINSILGIIAGGFVIYSVWNNSPIKDYVHNFINRSSDDTEDSSDPVFYIRESETEWIESDKLVKVER